MNRRKTILAGIISTTAIISIILVIAGKPAYPVIILGALLSFIVFGVWTPPAKHKRFGYKDQQRAMRAFDRTDALDFEIGSKSKKRPSRRR